jgi:hypothetical protein
MTTESSEELGRFWLDDGYPEVILGPDSPGSNASDLIRLILTLYRVSTIILNEHTV